MYVVLLRIIISESIRANLYKLTFDKTMTIMSNENSHSTQSKAPKTTKQKRKERYASFSQAGNASKAIKRRRTDESQAEGPDPVRIPDLDSHQDAPPLEPSPPPPQSAGRSASPTSPLPHASSSQPSGTTPATLRPTSAKPPRASTDRKSPLSSSRLPSPPPGRMSHARRGKPHHLIPALANLGNVFPLGALGGGSDSAEGSWDDLLSGSDSETEGHADQPILSQEEAKATWVTYRKQIVMSVAKLVTKAKGFETAKNRAQEALKNRVEQREHERVKSLLESERAKLREAKEEITRLKAALKQTIKTNPNLPAHLDDVTRESIITSINKLDKNIGTKCCTADEAGKAFVALQRSTIRVYNAHRLDGCDDNTAREKAVNGLWPQSVGTVRKRGLKRWIKEFEKSGDVGFSGRGTNHSMYSPIHDVDVQSHMLAWLNGCPKNSVTIDKFLKYLNDELLPPLVNEGLFPPAYLNVSKSTAGNWLKRLGWVYGLIKKGAYTDGHDAPDTVTAHNAFLTRLKLARTLSAHVDPNDPAKLHLPNLKSKAAHKAARALGVPFTRHPPRVVIIYHDETTVRSQDGVRFAWMQAGTHGLMHKSLGRALMLSDFLCLDTGFLTCANEAGETQSTGILWDVKTRGKYFDGEAVTDQWENDAFPTFERLFEQSSAAANVIRAHVSKTRLPRVFARVLGKSRFLRIGKGPKTKNRRDRARLQPRVDCLSTQTKVIGLWIFDCATSHTAFAQDALRATPMNKGRGGKQPMMRNGWYWTESPNGERVRTVQEMWMLDEKGQRIPKGSLLAPFSFLFTAIPRFTWVPGCNH